MRAVVLAVVLVTSPAYADDSPCGAFSSHAPAHPLIGKLRWDVAAGVGTLDTTGRFDTELALGVTDIFDVGFQSLDVGIHVTTGGAFTSPRAIGETVEGQVRWYVVKLRQALGIDECGQGTKTRRWSEHNDGVGYIVVRSGYGHLGESATHDAILLTPGLGYEWNLGDGRMRSTFVQLVWRADLAGTASPVTLSGLVIEAGLRL